MDNASANRINEAGSIFRLAYGITFEAKKPPLNMSYKNPRRAFFYNITGKKLNLLQTVTLSLF